MRVAVVGATGAVGSTMLGVMRERASRPTRSSRSPPSARPGARSTTATGDLDGAARSRDEAIQGFDLALFSAGGAVSASGRRASPRRAPSWSTTRRAWRMDDDVPLVVAEVNPDALDAPPRASSPTRTARRCRWCGAEADPRRRRASSGSSISTYQSMSGTGQRAVEELHDQAEAVLEAEELPAPSVYPHQIAFNVLPQVETFKDGDDYTTEERKMMRRDAQDPRPTTTSASRRPACACPSTPATPSRSTCRRATPSRPRSAASCWRARPGRDRRRRSRPTASTRCAIDAAGRDDVLVGRIRRDPSHERCLNLWIVGDNLRKGAATNAVQLAELLNVRGLLRAARSRLSGRRPAGAPRPPRPAPDAPAAPAHGATRCRACGRCCARGCARSRCRSRARARSPRWSAPSCSSSSTSASRGGEELGALDAEPVQRRRRPRPSAAARASRARRGGSR